MRRAYVLIISIVGSEEEVLEEVRGIPEVKEVHIITGDWDFLIKVKERDVVAVGNFVVDKLRTVQGISKTLTCMVFDAVKETMDIPLPPPTRRPTSCAHGKLLSPGTSGRKAP